MGQAVAQQEPSTHYEVLGIEPGAPADEVRRAFHRFAARYHPDRHPGLSAAERDWLEAWYRRGTEAYRVLLDPAARREYDRRHGLLRDAGADRGLERGARASGRLQVRNPRARPFARKAQKAMQAGDWRTAILNLRLALGHDPDNELLQARLAYAEEQLGDG